MNIAKLKRSAGSTWRKKGLLLGFATALLSINASTAFGWDYARVPLFWSTEVNPNVAFVADTSRSMQILTTNEAYTRDMQLASPLYAGTSSDKRWHLCSGATQSASSITCSASTDTFSSDDTYLGFRTPTFNWEEFVEEEIIRSELYSGIGNTTRTTCSGQISGVYDYYLCLNNPAANLAVGEEVYFSRDGSTPFNNLSDGYYFVQAISGNGVRLATSKGGTRIQITKSGSGTRNYTLQKVTRVQHDSIRLRFGASYFNSGVLDTFNNNSASNIQLCHVGLERSSTGHLLGSRGSAKSWRIPNGRESWMRNLKPQDIGAVMARSTSTGQASCVRVKEASTAQSPTTDGTLCNDKATCANYPETQDVVTPYLATYLNFLLNYHARSTPGSYNFSDKSVYPDVDNNREVFESSDYWVIPPQNRIQAMREGVQQVVLTNNENMNIGLFHMEDTYGAMDQACDAFADDHARLDIDGQLNALLGSNNDITDLPFSALDGVLGKLKTISGTPLARTYYEAVSHIQGQKGWNGKQYTSPAKYRCQDNYIVALTDGDPSNDTINSSNRGQNALFTAATTTGNYDGITDTTDGNNYSASNGMLDDIAQFAFDRDFKTGGTDAGGKSWNDKDHLAQNIITYTIGFALENGLLKDTPLSDKKIIERTNISGKTIKLDRHGLETGTYILYTETSRGDFKKHTTDAGNNTDGKYYAAVVDANHFKVARTKADATACANGDDSKCMSTGSSGNLQFSIGPGKSFFPQTADELARDLNTVFAQINKLVSTASAVATNSKRLGADSLVYQARFNTDGWSGELAAYKINEVDGTVDTSEETGKPVWTTNNTMASFPNGRTVLSWNTNTNTAVDFDVGNLSAEQQAYLGPADKRDDVSLWLQGKPVSNPDGFRNRPGGLLGDIINSDPVYVGAFNYGYTQLPPSDVGCTVDRVAGTSSGSGCTGAETYNAYITGDAKTRTPMLYVGANDGMLHGIVAGANGGQERLAYIPRGVYMDWKDDNNNGLVDAGESDSVVNKLFELSQDTYIHRYFVDGAPFGGDAFVGSQWKSYISGGLGTGGRSVYLIDVTNPTSFTANNIEWDFAHPKLGYSMSNTIIARMPNGKWYSIFGNGPDGAGDTASIFMVNIENANEYIHLETNNGGSNGNENGMMSVQVRVDERRTVTAIYGADLRGNIWRFDTSNMTGAGSVPDSARLLFTATDADGNHQPITGGMRLGRHPLGLGTLIYFGTGKYFEMSDRDFQTDGLPKNDTFYAVLDDASNASRTRDDLLAQEFKAAQTITGQEYRFASTLPVDYTTHKGWYIDLMTDGAREGEKVITMPVLSGSRIIFASMLPVTRDRCTANGQSWLNELDALTGGMLSTPVLDTNNDGKVNEHDTPVSSVLLDGYASEPLIISAGEIDYKLMGSTSSKQSVISVREAPPRSAAAAGGLGRMSWQQLQ